MLYSWWAPRYNFLDLGKENWSGSSMGSRKVPLAANPFVAHRGNVYSETSFFKAPTICTAYHRLPNFTGDKDFPQTFPNPSFAWRKVWGKLGKSLGKVSGNGGQCFLYIWSAPWFMLIAEDSFCNAKRFSYDGCNLTLSERLRRNSNRTLGPEYLRWVYP